MADVLARCESHRHRCADVDREHVFGVVRRSRRVAVTPLRKDRVILRLIPVDRAAMRRKSVLDLVKTEFDALKGNPAVSKQDRDKLDLHFSTIRDVETGMGAMGLPMCNLPAARQSEIMAVNASTVTTSSQRRRS